MAERFNAETDLSYNREPGIVVVPGSNYAKEMAKWEQFPSKYGDSPGNPYAYRPFPKMVYKADLYQGKVVCLAPPPNPAEFSNPSDCQRAEEHALRFTQKCQLIVRDERELQVAFESGYRESPAEAVECLQGRVRREADAAAERNWQDRNMGEKAKEEAKAEVARAFTEEGRHAAEVPEKPIKRSHSEAMKKAWETRRAKEAAKKTA
jgi:hypothetical protein